MSKSKSLTKRQLAVIEDLFDGQLDEPAALEKHKVKPSLYNKWLNDQRFAEALEQRIARSYRAGQIVLARYTTTAASKLVALTECEKEETARKACLDIITPSTATKQRPGPQQPATTAETKLSPEMASRILEVLAEEENTEGV